MTPIAFLGVASFFIGGLFDEPLCVSWDCSFFYRRSFDEMMNEGSDSAALFMAPRICTKALVEVWGNEVY
jgi:hypothetical protein